MNTAYDHDPGPSGVGFFNIIKAVRGRLEIRGSRNTTRGISLNICLDFLLIFYLDLCSLKRIAEMSSLQPSRGKILIVDDSLGMLETLEDILTDKNFEVFTASDPVNAIQKVRDHSFQLVLLDIKMPGKNGVELLQEMKLINPSLCAIMITAYAAEDIVREAIMEGAYTVINKPFNIDRIVELIQRALTDMTDILILIVDDEINARETLSDILEDRGFKVSSAGDGGAAIDLLKSKRFDIIFLDAKMPGLNGLETFLGLRRVNPSVSVVMMSGFGREETVMEGVVKECLSRNAYAYVPKPFDPPKILNIIDGIRFDKPKPPFLDG
jgi:DNA-binding NtrC family response regulator